MEQTIFQYPFYRSNQFLTSQDLNDSFSYLEEQERLTRSKMIGNGIVSGLDYSLQLDGTGRITTGITINPGFGITPDGYSIDFPVPVLYEYMVLYSDYNMDKDILDTEKTLYNSIPGIKYLLFTKAEIDSGNFVFNSNSIKPINLYADYTCLGIVADIRTETSFNCNPSDCSVNSSTDNIIYRPVIINFHSLKAINKFYTDLHYLKLQYLSNISGINDVASFNTNLLNIFNENVNRIGNFLNFSYDELLPNESFRLYNAYGTFVQKASGNIQIYYLSALNDLQAAINEFVNAYNNYIHTYTFSSADRLNQLLVLGEFLGERDRDCFRYTYIEPVTSDQYKADSTVLSNRCLRIAVLMEEFVPANNLLASNFGINYSNSKSAKTPVKPIKNKKEKKLSTLTSDISTLIKIIPCRGYAEKLGNRSIPYYFKGDDICQFWHVHDLDIILNSLICYYYFNDLEPESYNVDFMHNPNYPFYRIEGHIGTPVDDAYNYLNTLISNFDIPIQLIKVDITNLAWIGFKTGFDQFASIYKNFLDDLNKQILSQGNNTVLTNISKNLNKISQNFCETSYRDITGVSKVLDDVNAYCNLIISPDFVAKTFNEFTNYKVKVKTKSKTKTDTVAVPISQLIETTLKKYNIFDLRNSLAGLYAKPTPITEISLSQIKGLEYLAGVYKGGTFVLLYDGSLVQHPVIADFALPYFYNLDRGRLY